MANKKSQNGTESESDFEGSGEEYVVERVVDKRLKGGRVEYKLKWKGYPE
jgi:hypothetical protein